MGRKPIGKVAMTGEERTRRYRLKHGLNKPPKPNTDKATAQLEARIQELEAELAQRACAQPLPAEQTTDPSMLSLTAQQKLDAAIRQHQRKRDMEHAARTRDLDEEVRQRVLKEGREYLATLQEMRDKVAVDEKWYRTLINDHKPPFTHDQYMTICMCVHPDGERTPAKLNAAFILLEDKREMLTGERQKKRIV